MRFRLRVSAVAAVAHLLLVQRDHRSLQQGRVRVGSRVRVRVRVESRVRVRVRVRAGAAAPVAAAACPPPPPSHAARRPPAAGSTWSGSVVRVRVRA